MFLSKFDDQHGVTKKEEANFNTTAACQDKFVVSGKIILTKV